MRAFSASFRQPSTACAKELAMVLFLAAFGTRLPAAEQSILFTDRFGDTQAIPAERAPSALRSIFEEPSAQQIPTQLRGTSASEEVNRRIRELGAQRSGFTWFPATPISLAPYLAGLDEFGNASLQSGAIFSGDPLSPLVQRAKSALSEGGLRYSFDQSISVFSMSGVSSGASALQYYHASFASKWAIFEARDAGTAGWLSAAFDVRLGLSSASRHQLPQGNLGSLVSPNGSIYGPNGAWLAELAWQQSLLDGELVIVAGLLNQYAYLDANRYSGHMLNGALGNSMVLPLTGNNLGLNVQWQPSKDWYVIFGSSATNQPAGGSPFQNLGFENWAYILELGFTPQDVLGLGPGAIRLQPCLTTVEGDTQAGISVNVEQRLGKDSPFAVYGRAGVGSRSASVNGASAQVAGGLAVLSPLKRARLFPKLADDFFSIGGTWSQVASRSTSVVHRDEYGLEVAYILQVTPTASIQPDFQLVWNPAWNLRRDLAAVFQIQLSTLW